MLMVVARRTDSAWAPSVRAASSGRTELGEDGGPEVEGGLRPGTDLGRLVNGRRRLDWDVTREALELVSDCIQ